MPRIFSLRWLALVMTLFAVALAAGSVLAAPNTVTPQQAAIQPAGSGQQAAAPYSPTTLPYTTLVDLQAMSPQTLDPHWLHDTTSDRMVAQVYETLLMYRADDSTAHVPLLATPWVGSSDARAFTFTLRSGVTFHQGGTLEPDDVAYSSWRGLLQDRTDGPMWLWFDLLFDNAWTIESLPGDDLPGARRSRTPSPSTIGSRADLLPLQQGCKKARGSAVNRRSLVPC